ncbi:DUF4406 domain-containing protein [Arachidicoccus terrestris]|uniref:DUF4406 domain-containing protein n=1 Tax=Arachidicoccus terrestris TaxID=2875539 RepID=UPI001CC4C2F6|nr:DUF4406 domain-containing protein [Arachidicoccus terrestris]UAY56252.1 DUF4406 domain-containing protein [Arachidicoccus terrestris]
MEFIIKESKINTLMPPIDAASGLVKVYIAGKISGLDPVFVEQKFLEYEIALRAKGYLPFNPYAYVSEVNEFRKSFGWAPLTDESDRNKIMRLCVGNLMECDEIHLLPCWVDSQGARTELEIAQKFGIRTVYCT